MKEFNTKIKIAGSKSKNLEKNEGKKIVNITLARLSKIVPKKFAIVLDGRDRCTTKALVRAGWNRNKIHIPNFSEDYKAIKRYHKNTYNKSLGEFIDSIKTRKNDVTFAYFDYMCCFDGNANVCPMSDIKELFNNNIMAQQSIFGITICLRNPKKKNITPFTNNDQLRTITYIQDAARANGYKARLIPMGGPYKNGGVMCSLMWQLL